MAFHPIEHHNLKLGHFIKINASWFSHPFPTNTFKVRTHKELETLRGLKKVQIYFDPERSEVLSSEDGEENPDLARNPQPLKIPSRSKSRRKSVTPVSSPVPEPVLEPEPLLQKVLPVEAFGQHCEAFRKADKAYQEAFQQSKAIMYDLSAGNFEGLEKAKELIVSLDGMIDNSEATTALMNVMSSNAMAGGMFMHALNVCILSLMVGREFGMADEELHNLSLGALFHDIGELNVPGKILLKRPNLTPTERDTYRQHPRFGREMVRKYSGIPQISLNVIYQHHERLDGSGYPMGLKGKDAISLGAKIVMVVDWYDDLCNDPDPGKRLTPSEALSYLFIKQKAIFSEDVIVVLIRILGVYPPGSLVQLSDGTIGMVISINKRARMRPLVLLYKDENSDQESSVLDLEDHDDLSITQNLRPMDVSLRIREALHPRRMLTYFAREVSAPVVSTVER